MKAVVKKAFKDKVTGQLYKVGDKIDLSKARYNEICKKGNFVEEIKTTKNN